MSSFVEFDKCYGCGLNYYDECICPDWEQIMSRD